MALRTKLLLNTLAISLLSACASDAATTTSTVAATTMPATTMTTTAAPTTIAPTTTMTPTTSVLFDFSDPSSATGWFNQNDTVMGGVSDSASAWVDGHLVFSGNLSLDNNGGFTSTFGPINEQLPALMSGGNAIVVTARGDSQTYLMQIRNSDNTRYIQRFTTVADSEQSYILPIADFVSVDWRLSPSAGAAPMDIANVVQIGFYLLDKQVGPFEIAISSISADAV
ncbi:MAG: CIA30 family protein [Actinobacteria bacterium]|nr:CIA30 family protein [Actinomycetota bacterium]